MEFLKKHYERILVILAVFGLAILTGYFVWGAKFLTSSFNQAIKVEGRGGEINKFNVEGIEYLNLEMKR